MNKFPKHVENLLHMFNDAGFQAYVVGGAVRDIIIGGNAHDYDITTDALPEETQAVLTSNGIGIGDHNGSDFGTIIGYYPESGDEYEITTLRGEVYGADSHRPERVFFVKDLKEDLSRRDLTINSMAMDVNGVLHDPFGGREDITNGVIRTVGSPQQRFAEDGARMFRVCRFAAKYGFEVDEATAAAIPECLSRVQGLSRTRVLKEIEKTLTSSHPERGLDLMVRSGLAACSCSQKKNGTVVAVPILPELNHLVGCEQNPKFHTMDTWGHTLQVVNGVSMAEDMLTMRWAALLHDVGKGMSGVRSFKNGVPQDLGHEKKSAEVTSDVLIRMGYQKNYVKPIVWLVRNHMRLHQMVLTGASKQSLLKFIISESHTFGNKPAFVKAVKQLTALSKADCLADAPDLDQAKRNVAKESEISEAIISMILEVPLSSKDLNYDPRMFKLFGRSAKEGIANLLDRVQHGQLPNDPASLMAAAQKWVERRKKK